MQILHTVAELRQWSREGRSVGHTIGLVPTMGALHAGHASLIRTAAASCDQVAVSVFVNPTQFGPNEDYAVYPRTLEADSALAEVHGADIVFAPSVEELYPAGAATFVEVEGLSSRLDGASRPGHFRGVTTVVSKLLIAAEPDRAFFGQKDAAQVAVLRRMVTDLLLPTEIEVCLIVREADGLALSSRNLYLSAEERMQALILSRVILETRALVDGGERRAGTLIAAALETFAKEPEICVDYVELVNWATLEPVETAVPGSLFAVARGFWCRTVRFAARSPATIGGMSKTIIATNGAPAAIGPYSQGVRVGNLVFTAGQIPLDPATQQVVASGITEQTTRVLENLKAILEASGSSLANVVKTTVFLKDLKDFADMNAVYGAYLAPEGVAPPARTTVEISRLPKDVLVEIEVVAEI
jgi:pantoate--beta-alanine ligase